jgi:DNA-directed RNA polymerase subunit N (RpoN/RPB10)
MKINCLSCGHKVDLDNAYDDYEGQVKCFACGAILEMKTEHGELRSVQFVKIVPRPSTAEVLERSAR